MAGIRNLDGKRLLLTGAAGGIGVRLCRRFFQEGCRLVLLDKDEDGLKKLAAELDCPQRVSIHTVNLASSGEIDVLVDKIGTPDLHILINNAGLAPGAEFGGMDPSEVRRVMAVNAEAAIHLTHRLLPRLLASRPAQIVNVASAAGLMAPGGMAVYAASKFAMVGFSEALRAELHERGVGVSAICPAFVKTDIVRNSSPKENLDAAQQQRIARLDGYVKAHAMDPEKVVRAVLRAIRRDLARVVLGVPYRTMIGLRFFFPRLVDMLNRRNFEKLRREGLLG